MLKRPATAWNVPWIFMNKFRKLGFIDYNGHLEVHSSLLNVVLHDQPQTSAAARVPPRSLRELSTRLCRGILETSSSALQLLRERLGDADARPDLFLGASSSMTA
jgi:hypothetical protein